MSNKFGTIVVLLGGKLATWSDVEALLGENFERDFSGTFAGPGSYAAVVPNEHGSEVVIVFDGDFLVQLVGILDKKAFLSTEKVFPLLGFFGIKKTSSAVALQHFSVMATLDVAELLAPMRLMSAEISRINQSL